MRGGGRDGAAIGGGVGAASLDADTSPARGRRQVPIGSQPAGPQAAAGAGRGRSPRSAAPAWRRPRPGPNDADLRRFALCVGRRDTSSAERRQPSTRRVERLAARIIGVAPLERRGMVARKSRRHACMLALPPALLLLSHVLLRPAWHCSCYRPCGCGPRAARLIPFEGDTLTNTDFCLSATTDCTDPFDDRGTPKSSLPTNVLGTQLTCDLVAVRRGPTGRPSPRTAVRARAILEDLNEGDRR